MEERREHRQHGIGMISKAFGPDFGVLGCARHQTALSSQFRQLGSVTYSNQILRIIFCLTVGGRFEGSIFKEPITTRVRRVSASRDGYLFIDIGIGMSDLLKPEAAFRASFIAVLKLGAERAVHYVNRKQIPFDSSSFMNDLSKALAAYEDLELPLEPTKDEIQTKRFLGIE